MPPSDTQMQHQIHGGQGDDLERHPSATPLKLIAIPLYREEGTTPSTLESSQGLQAGGSHHVSEKAPSFAVKHDGSDHHSQRPIYKRRTEANSTELFFDLFFVANLTVFSGQHEVDDGESMSHRTFYPITDPKRRGLRLRPP